jgi:succinoglycan biosynthesis protein ExoV
MLETSLILDDDETVRLVGIGTLLNKKLHSRIPGAKKIIVFGTGVGYNRTGLPEVNENWRFYCVRGQLSAQALGLPDNAAVVDPGMLVSKLFTGGRTDTYKYAYMPHVDQAEMAGKSIERICSDLGYRYIDPRLSVDEVLQLITNTDVLLTEAMHGAIFADALRTPWIPIITTNNISEFKWREWCGSINIEFSPAKIYLQDSWRGRLTSTIKNGVGQGRLRHRLLNDTLTGQSPLARASHWFDMKSVGRQLSRIAQTNIPVLSNKVLTDSLVEQLELRIENLRSDFHSGRLSV